MITVLFALSLWVNIILAINFYEYYQLQKNKHIKQQRKMIDLILQKDGLL